MKGIWKAGLALALAASPAMAAPPLNLETDVDMAGSPQSVFLVEHDFDKGESSGLHYHHGVELAYVLRGTMRISVAGQAPFVVHPGDSFRVEREVRHEALNIGDTPSALIIAYVVDKGRPVKERVAAQP
jgi:quercetin dioxygenase-like cupin family protein